MNKPPDDPGGGPTQVAQYVTIEDSSVDTDTSHSSISVSRKRSHTAHKTCKHCNKRRKKRNNELKPTDCQCSRTVSEIDQTNVSNVSFCNGDNNGKENVVMKDLSNLNNNEPQKTKDFINYRTQYERTDLAPYIIHIQKNLTSPNDNFNFHPVSFGRFLKNNVFRNIIDGSLKKIGRNRLALSFSDYNDANNFINDPRLSNNNYKAFIPSFNISRVGIVRGVPSDWTPDEIINNVNVPIGCGKIMKVRRLNHKISVDGNISWKPTETVVITFDGKILPKRVYICYNALTVDLYIYPTIQCYKCCRYGHTKITCRSNPRCFKCGKDHSGDSCINEEDWHCCLCKGSHFATSKSCPEHLRQKNIKMFMAQNCVSYAEASKNYPPVTKSYANALATPNKNNLPANQSKTELQDNFCRSYKKTIFQKPKSPSNLGKGYDHDFHNAVSNEYNTTNSSVNGTMLTKNKSNNQESESINMILSFIKFLSQSQIITPSNAALMKESLINFSKYNINHGQTNPASMELAEHHQQEK